MNNNIFIVFVAAKPMQPKRNTILIMHLALFIRSNIATIWQTHFIHNIIITIFDRNAVKFIFSFSLHRQHVPILHVKKLWTLTTQQLKCCSCLFFLVIHKFTICYSNPKRKERNQYKCFGWTAEEEKIEIVQYFSEIVLRIFIHKYE